MIMEIKQDFSKTHANLCHDGYEFRIRCMTRAIDILEIEQAEDKYEDDPVHPLGPAIDILRDKIWKEFNAMCSQKADYDKSEWVEMYNAHTKRAVEQKHIQTKGE